MDILWVSLYFCLQRRHRVSVGFCSKICETEIVINILLLWVPARRQTKLLRRRTEVPSIRSQQTDTAVNRSKQLRIVTFSALQLSSRLFVRYVRGSCRALE